MPGSASSARRAKKTDGNTDQTEPPAFASRSGAVFTYAVVAGVLLVADLLTKWIVFQRIAGDEVIPVIPGLLNLRVVMNPGAVFGIGKGLAPLFVLFALAAAVGLTWAAARHGPSSRLLTVGLGCLLGGALGNLWDRVTLGQVRDFIDLYAGTRHWPTFNVADIAICAGAAAIVLHAFLHPEPKKS